MSANATIRLSRREVVSGATSTVITAMTMTGTHADSETTAGWVKSPSNPVLGGKLGTCFDICVLSEPGRYRMWFSWRPRKSIALVESSDGIHWSDPPVIVVGPDMAPGFAADVNRPVVVRNRAGYHMWFTGQADGRSAIFYAVSQTGDRWERRTDKHVLVAELPWEKIAVMCPHVIYDERRKQYRMWYSGGEQYEPNAIGYATSTDGIHWAKHPNNPVFAPDPASAWERDRVTACQVIREGPWHVMFYIGFADLNRAQVGIARSRDGITNWERHPANPIIRPDADAWDADAVYKPFAVKQGVRWMLWYNGRRGNAEQIGLATHEGVDLGFARD